ncbi:hypothetical protein J5N97_024685 [Dioscorea zingiberensis]|uniref:NADH:ubiquinone oxidoreductase intermediate-associated protein 30 domain-containing protein n=1 Tax=Dioscorea zingiberensis TaxID=325984 RepID=A0A9D5C7Q6_9LILI|nr:hypothetical protein J5N97_024685 [Dioscorea zingiberensis]
MVGAGPVADPRLWIQSGFGSDPTRSFSDQYCGRNPFQLRLGRRQPRVERQSSKHVEIPKLFGKHPLSATKRALSWNVEDLMPPTEKYVFNFNEKESLNRWHLYSDSEYGGLSSASLEITDSGSGLSGIFSGNLSSDLDEGSTCRMNRSGFCRMRSKKFDGFIDLDAYDAIALKLKRGREMLHIYYDEGFEPIPPTKEQLKAKWEDEDVDEVDVKESWEDDDIPPLISCSSVEKKESMKRIAAGDPTPMSMTSRHCRSISMDSFMGKLHLDDDSPKLPPSPGMQPRQHSHGNSMDGTTNAFSLEFGN